MKNKYRVYFAGRDFKGEGIYHYDDGSLTVLAGSKTVSSESNSLRRYYQLPASIKDELIEKEIIVDRVFMKDYTFDKPFHASAILSSYGKTGDKAWKTADGQTIKDIINIQGNIQDLKDYAEKFDPDKNSEKVESIIKDFNEKFPLDELPHLPIEKYDSLGSKETLTYAIERGTNYIFSGFLGNNINKIVYNYEDDKYDCIKALKNSYPNNSVEEIYEKYIQSIYQFITEFDRETYAMGRIGALPRGTNMIRSKLLTLYRPGETLHIGSIRWLREISNFFGLNHTKMDAVMMNIQLMNFMKEIGLEGSVSELSDLIGNFYLEKITLNDNIEEVDHENIQNSFKNIFLADDFIDEMVNVLKRKKAIILQGVPGVGKTFVIDQIVRSSFDNIQEDGIETIQFHQSYSYEEFVEGLRPQMDGGFSIEQGIFYMIAEKARENIDSNYFLIIDEINRGNMSKIFGELLMLIENDKRDEEYVRLPYSKEEFSVPSNLYLIGTMNTADRSLALVDYAMRRRFSFITLKPAYNTDKFNRFLEEEMELPTDFIDDLNMKMLAVNELIEQRLGKDFLIGHSYFIDKKDNIKNKDQWFQEIVKYEILPMIEEYFFDDEESIHEIKEILRGKDA